MNQSFLDHITITTPTLEAGEKFIEKVLGVTPQKGGEVVKFFRTILQVHY